MYSDDDKLSAVTLNQGILNTPKIQSQRNNQTKDVRRQT